MDLPSIVAWALVAISCATMHVAMAAGSLYHVGIGKADITGPAADVNMMGYAMPQQTVSGIHTRLYARAYIVADPNNESKRFAFVNLDACMASQAVTLGVMAKLKAAGLGGWYNESNVGISGIHTHSGPGGYLQYVLYDITSLGFVEQSWEAVVDGIATSIKRAHENLRPMRMRVNSGELLDANINRSPSAYLANPEGERKRYKHDTDKEMTVLSMHCDASGRALGSVAWFPVHCTSINNTNQLISGDNKGVASQLMEVWARTNASDTAAEVGAGLVAAFGQSNVGDTSPNTEGTFCMDTGLPCDFEHSLCRGRNEMCIGRGPAFPDYFKSNEIIATRQAAKAQELLLAASEELTGPVDFRHAFIDMSRVEVRASNYTQAGRTCPAAMGFSFAAGTTDGPGAFDFKQGDTNGTAFWRVVRNFLRVPSHEQEQCQLPKPILLDTGNVHLPYDWQPAIVEIQIMRIGQFVILCVPGEFTTMAGRRLREAVAQQVKPVWGDVHVVIAGLTNTYSSYVTTIEEYSIQRYEGASTIFGPHTLDAYIQEFSTLADAMMQGKATDAGPMPPNLIPEQWSFLPPVVLDTVPFGSRYAAVVQDVNTQQPYHVGDKVQVVFQSACPRNNLRTEDTFLTVERLDTATGNWSVVHTDNDICTTYYWKRPHMLSSESTATITWTIPEGTPDGTYTIWHYGDYKHIAAGVQSFKGKSGITCLGRATSRAEQLQGQCSRTSGGARHLYGGCPKPAAMLAGYKAEDPVEPHDVTNMGKLLMKRISPMLLCSSQWSDEYSAERSVITYCLIS